MEAVEALEVLGPRDSERSLKALAPRRSLRVYPNLPKPTFLWVSYNTP